MFRITRLKTIIDHSGKSLFNMRKEGIIGGAVYKNIRDAMNDGSPIDNFTLGTIGKVAAYFDCHPEDFLEWIPDEKNIG